MKTSSSFFRLVAALALTGSLLAACGNKDPYKNGVAAGQAACDCYRLESIEEQEHCLDQIDSTYRDFLTDTAYTNAVETQMLRCISDGVLDIVKE